MNERKGTDIDWYGRMNQLIRLYCALVAILLAVSWLGLNWRSLLDLLAVIFFAYLAVQGITSFGQFSLVDQVQTLLWKLTARRFSYRVLFRGIDPKGAVVWEMRSTACLIRQKDIENARYLKRLMFGNGVQLSHPDARIVPGMKIEVEWLAYLGWH